MDYTEIFLKAARANPQFAEAVDIVTKNAEGGIWLIGGFVCRSIIQELYGVPLSGDADFDFIVERPIAIQLPSGWREEQNSYGNPKFIGPQYEIDYVPLENIHSITRRGLAPTIDNFLTGTPLNVQSIVYDVRNKNVIGDIGIAAIQEKIIAVNNKEQAQHRAQKKGVTVAKLVQDIADQFGFRAVF